MWSEVRLCGYCLCYNQGFGVLARLLAGAEQLLTRCCRVVLSAAQHVFLLLVTDQQA